MPQSPMFPFPTGPWQRNEQPFVGPQPMIGSPMAPESPQPGGIPMRPSNMPSGLPTLQGMGGLRPGNVPTGGGQFAPSVGPRQNLGPVAGTPLANLIHGVDVGVNGMPIQSAAVTNRRRTALGQPFVPDAPGMIRPDHTGRLSVGASAEQISIYTQRLKAAGVRGDLVAAALAAIQSDRAAGFAILGGGAAGSIAPFLDSQAINASLTPNLALFSIDLGLFWGRYYCIERLTTLMAELMQNADPGTQQKLMAVWNFARSNVLSAEGSEQDIDLLCRAFASVLSEIAGNASGGGVAVVYTIDDKLGDDTIVTTRLSSPTGFSVEFRVPDGCVHWSVTQASVSTEDSAGRVKTTKATVKYSNSTKTYGFGGVAIPPHPEGPLKVTISWSVVCLDDSYQDVGSGTSARTFVAPAPR